MNVLSVARTVGGAVASSSNVFFDKVLFNSGGIGYDTQTGLVSLNELGVYTFYWWVSVQGATNAAGTSFVLTSTQGDEFWGESEAKLGQVSGNGVIQMSGSTPVTVALRYTGGNLAMLSPNAAVKAALLVTFEQVHSFGALGRTGGVLDLTPVPQVVPLSVPSAAARNVDFVSQPNAIVFTESGEYRIDVFATGMTTAPAAIMLEVTLNGAVVPSLSQRLISAGGQTVTFAFTGYLSVNKGYSLMLQMTAFENVQFTFAPQNMSAMLNVQRV